MAADMKNTVLHASPGARELFFLLVGQAPPSPSPPSPFPFLSLPFPFPLPYPLEVGPYIAARRSGAALKLPQRVRGEPGRQTVSGAL